MRNYMIILTILLIACDNTFEAVPTTFVKVYGANSNSSAEGFLEKPDGGYIIYGSINENIPFGFEDSLSGNLPYIIETDAFGNQINARSYQMQEVIYTVNPSVNEINGGFITSMQILDNGNYFAILLQDWKGTVIPRDIGMILKPNLEIEEMIIFNDVEKAPPTNESPTINHIFKELVSIEGSSDFLVLNRLSADFSGSPFPIFSHGLHRMTLEGDISWVSILNRAESFPFGTNQGNSVTFDDQGNAVMLGWIENGNNCGQLFIETIDVSSGTTLNGPVTLSKTDRWHSAPGIVKLENGYAILEYSGNGNIAPDAIVNCILIADDQIEPADGHLLLLDDSFNIIERKTLASGLEPMWRAGQVPNSSIIQTRDGNLVMGFMTSDSDGFNSTLIIKTDLQGNEIWSFQDGRGIFLDLQETSDGGIAYVGEINPRGQNGKNWIFIKLDENGKMN